MMAAKTLKCQSCGSSSLNRVTESLVECEHCGATLMVKSTESLVEKKHSQKHTISAIIMTSLVLVVAVVLRIFVVPTAQQSPQQPTNVMQQPDQFAKNTSVAEKKALERHTAVKKTFPEEKQQNPTISIVSTATGMTRNGGIYWILKIRNDSTISASRANVVVSLFDPSGHRVNEQAGWSKKEVLQPTEESVVLVYIAEAPQGDYSKTMIAQARPVKTTVPSESLLKVKDFIIKEKSAQRYDIIGDVSNPHDHQVDFVKVIAVALNSDQQPIGIADAFVTTTNIGSHKNSGFKISAGTFLTEKPHTWSLWAKGRPRNK